MKTFAVFIHMATLQLNTGTNSKTQWDPTDTKWIWVSHPVIVWCNYPGSYKFQLQNKRFSYSTYRIVTGYITTPSLVKTSQELKHKLLFVRHVVFGARICTFVGTVTGLFFRFPLRLLQFSFHEIIKRRVLPPTPSVWFSLDRMYRSTLLITTPTATPSQVKTSLKHPQHKGRSLSRHESLSADKTTFLLTPSSSIVCMYVCRVFI